MRSELAQHYVDSVWAPFTQMQVVRERGPLVMVRAEGLTVVDETGKEYLDGHGGLWLANVGYGRREVIRAVTEQMEKMAWFGSFMGFSNEPSIRLAERLLKMLAPEGMGKVFFSGSGSEAVETALKMARQYWKLKGREGKYKIVSRHLAYHGVTMGAASATGITANRKWYEPLVPGFRHVPAPYCYRCPFHLTPDSCGLRCAAALQEVIDFEGKDTVAAFIAEPVQAAGGVIIPPPGYLQEVRRICAANDVLYISDEVVCGFGRTGTDFGARTFGIRPDMMVFAKGITSGYIPLGATAVTEEVYDAFLAEPAAGREFRHGNTYSGHPTACAAALANLRIIADERLAENAAAMGERLLAGLRQLESHPTVGDVNGIGLLARVELVKDKATRERFPSALDVGGRVARKTLGRGVVLRNIGDVITFSPPLTIGAAQVDRIVEAVDASIAEVEAELA